MATKVDNDLGPLSTGDLNERLGREEGETALANHPPARKVGGKRVTNRKAKDLVVQLPCAVCAGLPEIYANVTKKCEPGKTYKGLSKHNEHVNRVHSHEAWCTNCMTFLRDAAARESHLRPGICQPRELTSEERETYPTLIDDGRLVKVREWKDWIKDELKNSEDGLVVFRWKCIFAIIYPEKEIPNPLSISSASPPTPKSSQPSAPQLPTPPSSEQPRGKRQASSSPSGKPLGSRRKPASPEPQTMDERAEHAGSDAAPDDPSELQPKRDGTAPFKEQLPGCVNPGDLYRSPYSADDFQPRLPLIDITTALSRREATMDPDSLVFSETADSLDDIFFRPSTPSARPPAQDEAKLTFGAVGVDPDRGPEYPWEVPDGELDGDERDDDGEFAGLLNFMAAR